MLVAELVTSKIAKGLGLGWYLELYLCKCNMC